MKTSVAVHKSSYNTEVTFSSTRERSAYVKHLIYMILAYLLGKRFKHDPVDLEVKALF